MKKLLILIVLPLLISGCLFNKKKDVTGSYVLSDFPLEKFQEPSQEIRVLLSDLNFDYNKSDIKKEFKVNLDQIIKWLEKAMESNIHILVEGHCDERGSNEYNMVLAEKRALAVREYLIKNGIDSRRIQTISYGEEKPLDNGHNEEAWKKNRRAHFLIASE